MTKRRVSEQDFSSQVEDLLKMFGWRYTHFRPAYTSKGYRTPLTGHKGFPDYCCVRNNRLLFLELKSETGKLSDEQAEWITILGQVVGIEVGVYRPSDFEEVLALLEG